MPRSVRFIVSIIAVVLLTGAASAVADDAVTFPDTPAGRIAADFFEAFNSGNEERVRAFNATHRSEAALAERSIEERMETYRELRAILGDIEPGGVLADSVHAVTIHANAPRAGTWLQVAFTLEPEPPHKLVGIALKPAAAPEAMALSYDGWSDFGALVTQVRSDLGVPALAVAVADPSDVLHRAADGVRRADRADRVRTDDRFHIGSITKSMTATIVGRLVDRGRLDWNTTIAAALPDVAMRDEYRDVTLAQLLRHRGGIPPYTSLDAAAIGRFVGLPGTPVEQRGAFVAEVLMESPVAPPGTAQRYSNAGYALAGHIAERAAGASWESLMHTAVFEPCAMGTAGIGWPANADRTDQPYGHALGGDPAQMQELGTYDLGAFLGPAGNVHCSAADLARYGQMHLKGLLGKDGTVTAATMAELHTPDADTSPMAYACGWVVTNDGRERHWHNGSAGTFYATLSIYPEEQLVIAAVMNRPTHAADVTLEKMSASIVSRAAAAAR